jgi:hypothetical protein
MARHVEVIDVPLAIEQAFDAIADFSKTAEWDPGVTSAIATTSAPLRVGSRFRVEVEILGRTQTYGYAITDYERPSRVVLRGGDGHVVLTDEITFVSRGRRGTRITYEVRSRGLGLMRLFDPLVDLALPFIARRAAAGLRRYARTIALRSRTESASPPSGPADTVRSLRSADSEAKTDLPGAVAPTPRAHRSAEAADPTSLETTGPPSAAGSAGHRPNSRPVRLSVRLDEGVAS